MRVLRDSQKSLSARKTHVPLCGLSVSVSAFFRSLLIFSLTLVSMVHSYRTNIHLGIINMTTGQKLFQITWKCLLCHDVGDVYF